MISRTHSFIKPFGCVFVRPAFNFSNMLHNSRYHILSALRSNIVRSASTKHNTNKETSAYPDGWDKAKDFSKIPGPTMLGFIRALLPGGPLYKMDMAGMHKYFSGTFGSMCKMPGMLGRPDIMISYDVSHYESILRSEGVWPNRIGIQAFEHFRTHIRPDIFGDVGGLVTDQGESWQRLRTAANPVMMSPKVVRSYVGAVDEVARDFVRRVHDLRDVRDELPADFFYELNRWALESIGAIALDRRLGVLSPELDENADKLLRSLKDFFLLSFSVEMKPPIWKYYETKEFKKLMATLDTMTNCISKYIDDAIVKLERNEHDSERTSEMSVLQKLLKVKRQYAVVMTFDMLMAGIDTTSSAESALLYLLATNPDKQEKLRSEVFDILPEPDALLKHDDLERMPYMRASIREMLRVHPVVMGNVRATGQNMILNGYRVPKNTYVAMLTSNGPKSLVEEHDKFRPERWLRTGRLAENQATISPFANLPFGFGPRSCIGRRFAEMEMQVLTARLLRDYRIEWHHGPMQFASSFITYPSSELKFRLVPLSVEQRSH